jgi:hypothetical protein
VFCSPTIPGLLGRLSQKTSPATKLATAMPVRREADLPDFSFIVTPPQTFHEQPMIPTVRSYLSLSKNRWQRGNN